MLNIDFIIMTVQKLIKRYGTRDPFRICEELGVIIRYEDFIDLKGMYRKFGRNRYILLNRNLVDFMLIVVCLHELGHDQLHWKLGENAVLRDSAIFRNIPIELEANMYAAEVKFIDEEILDLVYSGFTTDQIAMQTGTCSDLVAIKLNLLKHKGYQLKNVDCNPYFLKQKCAEARFNETDYSPC